MDWSELRHHSHHYLLPGRQNCLNVLVIVVVLTSVKMIRLNIANVVAVRPLAISDKRWQHGRPATIGRCDPAARRTMSASCPRCIEQDNGATDEEHATDEEVTGIATHSLSAPTPFSPSAQ